MHTYTICFLGLSNEFIIQEYEENGSRKEECRSFKDDVLTFYTIKNFFRLIKDIEGEVEFLGVNFNFEKCDDENKIKFKIEADFEEVCSFLLRYKARYRYKISLNILNYDFDTEVYRCFLKVEYISSFGDPRGDFLVCKTFSVKDLKVTNSYSTNVFFDMIMKFKNGIYEYEEIFLDPKREVCLEVDIGKKLFCTVYTDIEIESLVNFLIDNVYLF